jgi:hypothetical protein
VSELDGAVAWAAGEVRDGRALHRLVADLDAEQREALRRVALVVLRPHALEAGVGAAVVRHLAEDLGAWPVALRVLARPDPALVGALYSRQPKVPRGRMWLQQAAFASGPAAALLVVCDEPREPSLTRWLYERKGPTSTLTAAADSLRERFGRASSLHAVLHVPDDLRALALEASLLFDWPTICGAGHVLPMGLEHVEELVALEPLPGRLVFQAVLKVKRRILAAVAVAGEAALVATLWELTTRADRELEGESYLVQRELMQAFAADERAALLRAVEQLALRREPPPTMVEWARDAVGPPTVKELLAASWFLSGHEAYGGDGGERLFAVLERGGVALSDAQRALLAVGLANDLNPAARVDGERLWPLGEDPAA